MPTQDTTILKEKILSFLRTNGPSLPEEHLKSKEKEAFLLLKEKKELIDSDQDTAIRVALRSLKDFAFPKEKEGNLVWKYFISEEKEETKKTEQEPKTHLPSSMVNEVKEELEKEKIKEKIHENNNSSHPGGREKQKNLGDKVDKTTPSKKKAAPSKKAAQEKKNEMFFNTVKEYLKSKNLEITDILNFAKNELTLIVKENEEEKFLIAYNKKKLTETDIVNTYKKAKERRMKYLIYAFGEPAKKTTSFIEAIKDLSGIETLE
jgi:hypothetical protein